MLTPQYATLLFSIGNETLTGSLKKGGNGWILQINESGAAEWLIVPLSEAAPSENQDYNIGGTFSYKTTDRNVSIPLLPTRITVAPDPSLIIHYFWKSLLSEITLLLTKENHLYHLLLELQSTMLVTGLQWISTSHQVNQKSLTMKKGYWSHLK